MYIHLKTRNTLISYISFALFLCLKQYFIVAKYTELSISKDTVLTLFTIDVQYNNKREWKSKMTMQR